jgi:lysophospholipase
MFSNLGKPIIFTGSQAPIFTLQTDAVSNLLGALIIAGSFSIPEVCLFFHHTLYRGNRTIKISASEFEAFASPNYEPLAKFNSTSIDINWHLIERATGMAPVTLQPKLKTDAVACIRIFPGIKVSMITSMIQTSGLRGLVLETFGAGNSPEGDFLEGIEKLVAKDIVIVNVSQCPSGTVSPLYAPAKKLGNVGVVFGHDLTTEAALTKLAYLFTMEGMSTMDIVQSMTIPHRGELTATTPTLFQHPPLSQPVLDSSIAAFTLLSLAIASGDVPAVKRAVDPLTSTSDLLRATDTLGNTALHLAACGPSTEVLNVLLSTGATVHARNKAGHTPLYLAAQTGSEKNVVILRKFGAHLHVGEVKDAEAPLSDGSDVWKLAVVIDPKNIEK